MCNCSAVGSFDSPPICDPRDGTCRCKANVEGQNCDRPKPGFFNLAPENIHGAIPCFCYGHSSLCESSKAYFVYNLTSKINEDSVKKWSAIDSNANKIDVQLSKHSHVYDELNGVSTYIPSSVDDVWFLTSPEFLGNQQLSYNQDLSFELRIVETQPNSVLAARPSRKDVVLESAQYNLEVYLPIYGGTQMRSNGQSLPSTEPQIFKFKLNQHSGWMPTLTINDFQRLLSNLSSIKIRASYAPSTRTILSKLSLGSAKMFAKKSATDEIYIDESGSTARRELKPATFVEQCTCPVGHVGQHCELCADGYRREPINGGPFARCVPCTCNNHSLSCDANTGKCSCLHHTNGDNCEKCKEGYYGNPIMPTRSASDDHLNGNGYMSEYELANMCKKCPCPNDGACAEIYNYQLSTLEVVCLDCPAGTQGNLCELCDDGYFNTGNSLASHCERCACNENIDENAIGNCDSSTGRCMRCIYNTTGDKCEKCLPNYWGNALTATKCHACECYAPGTHEQPSVIIEIFWLIG